MDLSQLANLGEFIGGVAVLVTLVYLVMQVRQNTNALHSAAIQTVVSDYRTNHINALATNPDLMSIFTRGLGGLDRLADDERPRFGFVLMDLVLQAQTALELHKRGTLSRTDYDVWINGIASFLRTPGGRECWEEFKWGPDPTISEVLSRKLRENEQAPNALDGWASLRVASVGQGPRERPDA